MKAYIKSLILISLFSLINCSISLYWLSKNKISEFTGFLAGALLSYILSIIFILLVKRGLRASDKKFLYYVVGGFPLRVLLFAIVAFSFHFLTAMSTLHFAMSFVLGLTVGLIIEIRLFSTIQASQVK